MLIDIHYCLICSMYRHKRARKVHRLMPGFAAIVQLLKEVMVLPSFQPVPGVASYCTVAGNARLLTGRPITRSTALLRPIERHRFRLFWILPRIMHPRMLLW